MVEARSTSSTLRVDPRAVLKQATEAADKASAGSNLSIKENLHKPEKKATLEELVWSSSHNQKAKASKAQASKATVKRAADSMSQTALLALQPEREGGHDSYERALCRGWSVKSHSPNVLVHLAGSVQPSQEMWNSHGHVFTSFVSRGYWAHMYSGKIREI